MVLKILRPHYWILDRQVRNTNRVVIIALILILGLGGQWLYVNLIRDNLALLRTDQAVTIIASYLPLGLFFFLLFAMLGIGDVMHQLYLASDLELMLIAPLPYRTIFLVKGLQCGRATLLPALGFSAILFLLGSARDAVASYYLLVMLLTLGGMILTTATIMILIMLLARWLPVQKTQSWMPVAVALVAFLLLFIQQPAMEWFLGQVSVIRFLAEALLDVERLALVVTGLGGLALVASEAAFRIFDISFHESWNRFREVPTRPAAAARALRRATGISRWVQPLPQPLRSFLVKEWLELRRDPRSLINFAQPLVLIVALVLFPALRKGSEGEILRPLLFWLMFMMLTMFLGILPIGTSLMSIAHEGRNMALLRSATISMSDMLKGKFWATWTPMALSWMLVLLVACVWLQFPLWQIGFLVGMTILGLAGASVMTVAVGGLSVDFDAEELKQRMSVLVSYLLMGMNLLYVLMTTTTFVWLMIRLFPDSRIVFAFQALSNFGVIGWLLSNSLLIPIALAGGQVLFWAGVKVLWDAAVRRLEAWEDI
jgi:hypothetical protein